VRVVGVEHEGGGRPAGELGDAAEWVWVVERPVGFGVVDCVPGDGLRRRSVCGGRLNTAVHVHATRFEGEQPWL